VVTIVVPNKCRGSRGSAIRCGSISGRDSQPRVTGMFAPITTTACSWARVVDVIDASTITLVAVSAREKTFSLARRSDIYVAYFEAMIAEVQSTRHSWQSSLVAKMFTHPAAPPWFNVVLPEPSK
jgi:hypothetical protein